MRSPTSTACTTDSGACTPSRLVEHSTRQERIGSFVSTSVSTHRVVKTVCSVICPIIFIFLALDLRHEGIGVLTVYRHRNMFSLHKFTHAMVTKILCCLLS